MKIIITGATGYIGQHLVPFLEDRDHELLLIGREKQKLRTVFPKNQVMTYDELDMLDDDYDALIFLAVLNNDRSSSLKKFREVNLDLLKKVISNTKDNISNMIYLSTFQINNTHQTSYSISKKEAEDYLIYESGIKTVTILRLPAVYSDNFRGKLSFLNYIPGGIKKIILPVVLSLKPTIHMDKVLAHIEQNLQSQGIEKMFISDQQKDNWFYAFSKRSIDILLSLSVIVFLFWLFPIIALLINTTSPGPVMFIQQRVGKNEKKFFCLKFRTMFQNTQQAGTHEVSNSSVTKIGTFLRKLHLDEMPQIWNVIKNEMSFVGPRPSLPIQDELIIERNKRDVLTILPGITGLSQVNGIDMSQPLELAESDEQYLISRSLLLDLKILCKTVLPI